MEIEERSATKKNFNETIPPPSMSTILTMPNLSTRTIKVSPSAGVLNNAKLQYPIFHDFALPAARRRPNLREIICGDSSSRESSRSFRA